MTLKILINQQNGNNVTNKANIITHILNKIVHTADIKGSAIATGPNIVSNKFFKGSKIILTTTSLI